MSVTDITSKAQFDELLKSTPYVALQAHAVWCGPCKAISPIFSKFAASFAQPQRYAFARFDTDQVGDLSTELGIRSIPAFFFFENGNKTSAVNGAKPKELEKALTDLSTKAKATESSGSGSETKTGSSQFSTNEDF